MINKLKLILAIFFLAPAMLIPVGVNAQNSDPLFGDACKNAPQSPVCKQAAQQGSKNPIVGTINTAANIIALLTGIAAVIMIIIGGFVMITSAGNAERVANARRRIVYSILGLIVVVLAWTITRFVANRLG